MRALAWLALLALAVAAVITPCVYFYIASKVPRLESEFDLEKLMRLSVEGERMSMKLGTFEKSRYTWERPDFSKIPKEFVSIYILEVGCPTYFQTPREEGWVWTQRALKASLLHKWLRGDGRCELALSLKIAEDIGIGGPTWVDEQVQMMAASKIHSFLQKDQLVAYSLAGTIFARAIVGLDDAAQDIYHRSVDDLQLSELAELSMALPDNGYYEDLIQCRNPTALKVQRNDLLRALGQTGLMSDERVKTAQAQPVACTRSH